MCFKPYKIILSTYDVNMRMLKYQIRIVIRTVYKKLQIIQVIVIFNSIQDLFNYFIFQLPVSQLLVLSPLDRAPTILPG